MASIGRCSNLLTHNIAHDGRKSFSSGLGVVKVKGLATKSLPAVRELSFQLPFTLRWFRIDALHHSDRGGGLGFSFESQSPNMPPSHSLAASKSGSQIDSYGRANG